jgi:pyocin large subunit-like protein
MRKRHQLSLGAVLALILALWLGTQAGEAPSESPSGAPIHTTAELGFGSPRSLEEHFQKHGAEFQARNASEYLAHAQALRDAPLSASVLELVRDDGVITRFDRKSGTFVAFDANGRIRTCFRPNDGEAYFRRQAKR